MPIVKLAAAATITAVVGLLSANGAGAHEQATTPSATGAGLRVAQIGAQVRAAQQPEPSLAATPRARCGPGARPEPDIQGRVPKDAVASGAAADGYVCNATRVAREGVAGGYKVRRFTDRTGRDCAYYDTTLLFPLNAATLSQESTGVAVLDMSNPEKPVRTATLVTPAMLSPHESVVLNERRGLLAAATGNPATYPGIVDIYDLNADCRKPELKSSLPLGVFGHESGFAPDGNTLYITSLGTGTITALDVGNPTVPRVLYAGQNDSHGLTVSDDGNRAYLAGDNALVILDVSEIQARRANPVPRELSRLTWPTVTIPQVALPVTIAGKPYLVEVDEFAANDAGSTTAHGDRVGAGRIIDISDERSPRVVSNIRLAVNNRENRAKIAGDPGAQNVVQGYAGHYCDVPRRAEPGIVACSFILSGLRVFDIRDPLAPKEVAYHVAPPRDSPLLAERSNFAMSAPAFVPERREVWYSDGNSGFYNVRLAEGAWPGAGSSAAPPQAPACVPSGGFASVSAKPADGGAARLAFTRRKALPVRVDVFAVSDGRRVVRERLVARFRNRVRSFTWDGRSTRGAGRVVDSGTYLVRFTMLRNGRPVDVRRAVLRRVDGRFTPRAGSYRRDTCGLLARFKLERPVFGGSRQVPLRASYRLSAPARVTVKILRGGRLIRQSSRSQRAGRTYRVAVGSAGLPAGDYRVVVTAVGGGRRVSASLTSRRL